MSQRFAQVVGVAKIHLHKHAAERELLSPMFFLWQTMWSEKVWNHFNFVPLCSFSILYFPSFSLLLYPHPISRVSRIVSQGARTAGCQASNSGFMVADRCVSNDFHGFAWMCVCVCVCMDYIAHCEKQIFCREHC